MSAETASAREGAASARLRGAIMALVLVGALGLLVELLLLDHFESVWQVAPLVLLAWAFLSGAAVAARPGTRLMRVFQATMALCTAVGLIGVYLHYRGNVEFEVERDATRRGLSLFWEAIRGATPALAPAALSQLGLLGLLYCFRHPVLCRRPSGGPHGTADDSTERR